MSVRVKICGLTHPDDVRAAIDAGADAIGIVLHVESARFVADPEPLLTVVNRQVPTVAVFKRWHGQAVDGFDIVQAFDVAQPPPVPWLPAHRDGATVETDLRVRSTLLGDALLDGAHGGGRGIVADWDRAARLARRCALVLAGGLTPANVGQAIQITQPAAVDVCSGVEASPDRKDHERLRAFVAATRQPLETP